MPQVELNKKEITLLSLSILARVDKLNKMLKNREGSVKDIKRERYFIKMLRQRIRNKLKFQ